MALRRDAQRNRERIVSSARQLFASDGVDVSVEDVTRNAGVGMGTLYRHFRTKQDLVDAVLEEAFAAYVGLAREALEADDAWNGLATFLEQTLELHASNRCLMDVVRSSEHGRAGAQATRRRVRPLLEEIVARGQAQGTLRRDVTADDIPVLLWSVGRVVETTADVAPELWRRQLGLLLDGLRAEAATPLPAAPLTKSQLARIR
jgi:AcrR family transcriptional regulator